MQTTQAAQRRLNHDKKMYQRKVSSQSHRAKGLNLIQNTRETLGLLIYFMLHKHQQQSETWSCPSLRGTPAWRPSAGGLRWSQNPLSLENWTWNCFLSCKIFMLIHKTCFSSTWGLRTLMSLLTTVCLSLCLQLVAEDADSHLNGAILYAIVSGDQNNQFFIDPISGVIKVNKPLDRETVRVLRLLPTRRELLLESTEWFCDI